MNSVPHFRSLASVGCIEIIVQVKILNLSSVVQLHFNFSIYNGEIVKLQCALNDDHTNFLGKIKHVSQPISKPIIGRFFPKTLARTFTSEQFH